MLLLDDFEVEENVARESLTYSFPQKDNVFTCFQQSNIKFNEAGFSGGVSRATQAKMAAVVNESYKARKFYNHYPTIYMILNHILLVPVSPLTVQAKLTDLRTCLRLIKEKTDINFTMNFDVCPKGCYLYDDTDDQFMTECPTCKAPRSSKSVVKMVRIEDKIAAMLSCKDVRDMIADYRINEFDNSDDINYRDFFSGDVYKHMKSGGCFQNKHDVAISLQVDGFSAKNSSEKLIFVQAVILSLPSSVR